MRKAKMKRNYTMFYDITKFIDFVLSWNTFKHTIKI